MIKAYLPTFCDAALPAGRKDDKMKAISKEYLLLFNAITNAEETLLLLRENLMDAQRRAEELYLEEQESDPD